MQKIAGIVAVLALAFGLSSGKEVDYSGMQLWGGDCQKGWAQSPIDIEEKKQVEMNEPHLIWKNNNTKFSAVDVHNGGNGFSVDGPYPTLFLSGGGLNGQYKLAQLHYHWGLSNDGSEHRINGKQWAAELHLVHFHSSFPVLSEALASKNHDALAVVGVMLRQEEREPEGFEKTLMDIVANITTSGQRLEMDLKTTINDFLPNNLLNFWRYQGSLTTPTCNQQVVWTVLKEELTIPKKMIETFAKIMNPSGVMITKNARRAQPLNYRKLYYNEAAGGGAATSVVSFACVFAATAIASVLSRF